MTLNMYDSNTLNIWALTSSIGESSGAGTPCIVAWNPGPSASKRWGSTDRRTSAREGPGSSAEASRDKTRD
eukprot:50600-Eustigmatos_ZCMA.PRE.1